MKRTGAQESRADEGRRRLLKVSAVIGGASVLGHLPYEKPAIKSFFGVRSAWAQPTGPTTISMSGMIGATAPGTPDDPINGTGSDYWEFEVLQPNTELEIIATSDDGFADIELFLFPTPTTSVIPGDINLLTGTPFGRNKKGVGGTEEKTLTVADAGIYTIVIEDARSPANEVSGAYTIIVNGDQGIGAPTQTLDEAADLDRSSG